MVPPSDPLSLHPGRPRKKRTKKSVPLLTRIIVAEDADVPCCGTAMRYGADRPKILCVSMTVEDDQG